jgi:hypothetical protein
MDNEKKWARRIRRYCLVCYPVKNACKTTGRLPLSMKKTFYIWIGTVRKEIMKSRSFSLPCSKENSKEWILQIDERGALQWIQSDCDEEKNVPCFLLFFKLLNAFSWIQKQNTLFSSVLWIENDHHIIFKKFFNINI